MSHLSSISGAMSQDSTRVRSKQYQQRKLKEKLGKIQDKINRTTDALRTVNSKESLGKAGRSKSNLKAVKGSPFKRSKKREVPQPLTSFGNFKRALKTQQKGEYSDVGRKEKSKAQAKPPLSPEKKPVGSIQDFESEFESELGMPHLLRPEIDEIDLDGLDSAMDGLKREIENIGSAKIKRSL